MAEELRSISISVELDTSKRTIIALDASPESINEAVQLLRNTADELEAGEIL